MKLAIIILAHKNPEQVARLCGRLRAEGVDIYIHVDKKTDQAVFQRLIDDVVFVQQRADIAWGEASLIGAMMATIQQVQPQNYDYVAQLSGQDYPLVPIELILAELEANMGREYIEIKHVDPKLDPKHYNKAIYSYPFEASHFEKKLHKLRCKLGMAKQRHYPTPDGEIYFGSVWWLITGACAAAVLEYHNSHPEYVRFFDRVLCSDENMIHSIIPYTPFAGNVVPYKHYIDWSAGGPNPKILTINDLKAMSSSGNWFARKFDTTIDSSVLDALDNQQHKSNH